MKNSNNLFLIGMYLIAAHSYAAYEGASPSLNSQCRYRLTTPHNGAGVMFNELCTIAYVLPPKIGAAEIASLARTTNLQFCPAVKSVGQVASRTFNAMNIISLKLEQMIHDFEPLDQDIINMRLEIAAARTKMDSAKKRFEDAETYIQELRQITREARQSHESCIEDYAADHPSCLSLKTAWDQAQEDVGDFKRGEYRESRASANHTKEEYELISARYNVMRNRYTEAIMPMIELQDKLTDLSARVMDLYSEYTQIEGATGQIMWTIPWDRLLNDYRQANRGLAVDWQRLPLRESELVTSIRTVENGSILPSITGLKSALIPGARPTGFAGMGAGQKVNGPQLEPSLPTQASITFGNGVSGQIALTLAGACPYFDGIDDRTSININELTSYMTANLVYSFDVAARRAYVASYNLSSMLHRVEEKTKRGGLFSTSAAHSIIDDADSSDWFSITFSGNSSDFQYSPEEQNQITQAVKRELFDKAMQQFAILNAGSAIPPSVPEFVDSGAAVGASELRKCWHKYCQIASSILGVADSIWGKSTATAKFHQNNSTWVTEQVNGVQFVSRTGSLSFRPE